MKPKAWTMQDAKNRFSEVVYLALSEGPQVVTRRGQEVVVVIARDEYARLRVSGSSLVRFFRESSLVGVDLDLERDRGPLRAQDP